MTGAMTTPAMRRYEISGEKFWQFELTGSEVLQEWGKIGGSGKSRSHKSYASEDAAKKELDKLIKKKTAEGFVEIGAATSAAPTPAPSPTPTPTPTPSPTQAQAPSPTPIAHAPIQPRIVWTDDAKKMVARPTALEGNEGSWLVTIEQHFQEKNWTETSLADRLKAGLAQATTTPEAKKWAERILASYAVKKVPADADVEGDAALVATWGPIETVAEILLARWGIVHLTKVMIASREITATSDGRTKGDAWASFQRSAAGHIHANGVEARIASRIRLALPQASDSDRAKVRAELDALWSSGNLASRLLAARASNDRAWESEATIDFLNAKKELQNYDMPNAIFTFLRDPALVTKLAKKYPSSVPPYELMHDMGSTRRPRSSRSTTRTRTTRGPPKRSR